MSKFFLFLRWPFLILIGFLIYSQTFLSGFIFDDIFFIIDNPYIRNFSHIPWLWHAFPMTRMVGIYSFGVNYYFNQFHPAGYHIFNFIVHLTAVGLVWALAHLLFKIVQWLPSEDRFIRELPFVIALLFLVHPCQTQAVTYISQRFESMATVFYLGTMYCYLRARLSGNRIHKTLLFGLTGVLAVVGIMTKEVAVTVPLMMLAAEWILFPQKESKRFTIVLAIGGVLLYLLFTRLVRTDLSVFLQTVPSESHDGDILTPLRYLMTQMRVFLTFLRLLVLPIHQNLDYDYPASTGLLSPPLTLVGLWVIAGIMALIIKLRRNMPLIAFGMAWVLITFSINLAPRANVIFEHKLYLISFGFFLAAVSALSIWVKKREVLVGILLCIITVLGIASFQRNKVWRNELVLWNDTVEKSPHKARPLNNRGNVFSHQGRLMEALADYNQVIAINPDQEDVYNNRGVVYNKQGRYVQAIRDFSTAIAMTPTRPQIYNNRGMAYARSGRLTEAEADYSKAIEIDPNYADAYNNRGAVYFKQGALDQALDDYNRAIQINPDQSEEYNNRGLVYYNRGRYPQAMADFNKAIAINPNSDEECNNRGNVYVKQGLYFQAMADFNKAVDINPHFAMGYNNRAVVFFQLKEYDKALENLHKTEELGIRVNPQFLDMVKRKTGAIVKP